MTEVIDPEDIMNLLQSLMNEKMSKETYEARKFHMEEEHMTPESIAKLATEAGEERRSDPSGAGP